HGAMTRVHGVFVTEDELQRIVCFLFAQMPPSPPRTTTPTGEISAEDEELVEKCLEIIRQERRASTSLIQRRLRLGYTRAARIIDILEQRGILGPGEGAKPREILVDLDATL
ncbi:MAG: DNA translocase FtsK, partial [Chthoniobacterales bacterium]|nr:DNA translocase FtsK [Chthoniobacterales bacterium]